MKYNSKLVGVTFENRQDIIATLKGDEKLQFRREPDNQYDSCAVAVDVFKDEWKPIGYISSANNFDISKLLDNNEECKISIASITGGDGKSFGVNVLIEHRKVSKRYIQPTYEGKLMPEILTQPNIPKPLHSVAPRTIMGDKWWDNTRKEVYKSSEDHCVACGVHKSKALGRKWVEAHEWWEIDYEKGICTIKSIQPLCHYCHNFIHSGRLKMIIDKEKTEQEVKDILEYGFSILKKNKLKCFPETLNLAKDVGAETYGVKGYEIPECNVEWSDWKLIFEGKEYKSKFKDYNEWSDYYNKLNNKESL